MARLPAGQHWISGKNKGLGSTGIHGNLTRQQTENLGARELGYRSAYQYNRAGASARSVAQELGSPLNTSPAAMNYRNDINRAAEVAALNGQQFDRAAFDANVAAMRNAERGSPEFQAALGQYLYDTGRRDRPTPVES